MILFQHSAPPKKVRKKNSSISPARRCLFFGVLAVLILLISILAPYIAPHDPYKTNVVMAKQPPSFEYPCGTDELGRCIFSRILWGSRTSIYSALLLVAIMSLFGSLLGILAGYYGGTADAVLMRITDFVLSFPQMIVAIVVAGMLGGSLVNAMIALGVTGWTGYARLARSKVISIKKEDYLDAARIANNSDGRILLFHVLPNVAGPLAVNTSIQISTTMLDLAGMSFLGLGVQVPMAEWGSMINEGRSILQLAPWIVLMPSLAILITVILFNLLGDSMRDLLDVEAGGAGDEQ